MIGWFAAPPLSWRTPNSLAFRIDGNGGRFWMFYEYGTRRWRTGGGGAFEGERYQTTTTPAFPADGKPHRWSLDYDPAGSGGRGEIIFRVDERAYRLEVAEGHRADYVMALSARASAALEGVDQVSPAHLARVAPYALRHRRPEVQQMGRDVWSPDDDRRVGELVRQAWPTTATG